jgi:IS5 family transposase
VKGELLGLWKYIQQQLIPALAHELGELSERDRKFVEVIGLLRLNPIAERYGWKGLGCPPSPRIWMIHALIAKEIYQFPTRKALVEALLSNPTLRSLCGWESKSEVPSESTFCRAFERFAEDRLPEQIHAELIVRHCKDKLVGHVSRDSTAIEAPDNSPIVKKPARVRGKPGRPPKGMEPAPAEPKRLDVQPTRALAENLADLPTASDCSGKRGSKGSMEYWRGYKLHVDVIDGDIPVSAILTSASTHDSQVAIPLMQMTAQRVTSCYQLMDAAYDAKAIREYAKKLGQVPIIEPAAKGEWTPLDPAERKRFGQRSSSERFNAQLKGNMGGRAVRVRGALKVMCHLMFGVVVIAASGIWGRIT